MRILTLLLMFLVSGYAFALSPVPLKSSCIVTGEVKKIYLGQYSSPYFTDDGEIKSNKVGYTKLSMRVIEVESVSGVDAGDCKRFKKGELSEIGLCEEQTVLVGDVIKGNTGGWADGPDCYVDVEFVK